MSSRDRSDQPRPPRRSSDPTRSSQPKSDASGESWDIDPAEIDRYLSGRPQRSETPAPARRQRVTPRRAASEPQSSDSGQSSTVDQIAQLRNRVAQDAAQRSSSTGSSGRTRPASPSTTRQSFDRSNLAPSQPTDEDIPLAFEPSRDDEPLGRRAATSASRERLLRSDPFANDIVVQSNEDAYAPFVDDAYDDEYDDDEDYVEERPRRERGPRRQLSAPTMPKLSMPSLPNFTVPPRVAQAAIFDDVVSLSLIGIGAVSLAVMSILVANRADSLASPFATHISASGVAEHLKTRGAIWSLPILGVFLMLMNIVIALFVARMDRFASRFVLGAGLVVQIVAWVAVIRILW
ncbi:MAG TPA: hypothetical protein VFQ54_08095 [Thermomicrobiales bacterium]|nr:hypothetical protein [Thermomicrobiales bacterium]